MDKTINYVALGDRIRTVRKQRHLSQEKLGEICQISTAHVGHIERGTRIPSLETLYKISKELNISMDYLFFDSQNDINSVFKSISAQLAGKDGEKVKVFISTVKALADKIDDL
ncbi:MAG: helix-turn-helix transcriptional regulator [Clostridia bacterium]|nr:helix-turn-helix transcriptional regulator [Clostridia bacterium]